MEHPMAERPGTPTPGLLRLRRWRDGISAVLVIHCSRARCGGYPGAEARRRHGVELLVFRRFYRVW